MSGISAIIQETEDTLCRAKVLLNKPGQLQGDSARGDRIRRKKEKAAGIAAGCDGRATAADADADADADGGDSAHDAGVSQRREDYREAPAQHSRQRQAHLAQQPQQTRDRNGHTSHPDRRPTLHSSHPVLREFFASGLPHISSGQADTAGGHGARGDAPAAPVAHSTGSAALHQKIQQLENVTQQQALELQYSYKTMSAMQMQLDAQRQTVADLQSELLPLLSAKRNEKRSADGTMIPELQKTVNQLQQDVFTHLTRRRKEEEQRKQRLESTNQQVQWIKDTASHDNKKVLKEVEAMRLTIDRHEAQLTSYMHETQAASTQMSSMQRAITNSEHALQSSRQDLLGQMNNIRVGLSDISATLASSAHAHHLHSATTHPHRPNGHNSAGHHPAPLQQEVHRQNGTRARENPDTYWHRTGKSEAPGARERHQRQGLRRGKEQGRAGGVLRKHNMLFDSSNCTSTLMDETSSSPSASSLHVAKAAPFPQSASTAAAPLDSDFEQLREEDDRLLAELEQYTTPDTSSFKMDNSSGDSTTF